MSECVCERERTRARERWSSHPTRWNTRLSSKVHLLHVIDLRALRGASLVRLASKCGGNEPLVVQRVVTTQGPSNLNQESFLEDLSTFGDKCPHNGSKNGHGMPPRRAFCGVCTFRCFPSSGTIAHAAGNDYYLLSVSESERE